MQSSNEPARFNAAHATGFEELHKQLTPKFRRPLNNLNSLTSWLWATCHNVCRDCQRTERRRQARERPLTTLEAASLGAVEEPDGVQMADTSDAETEIELASQRVERAIALLPVRQFEAVRYRWILGYSTRMTAQLMHVSQARRGSQPLAD